MESGLEPYCALCLRVVPERLLTKHHCLPKSKGGTTEHIALLCGMCHSMVHTTFENRTLAREYASVEDLREAAELQPFLKWVRKQPATRKTKHAPRRNKR
ncbi:HNH endonuclease [Tuwongella immobilis]|uniref:HNH domain-containing protein n=1 Tax=Tuwongella immobilis TaxID=692036 RepID=A0A6C2YIM2_9BACT|nr:HNH endonuclease signature motif containing protein [Tuwongella immobilis]VIP01214.1 Uncharacterized protein OS=Deinococcus gobiensis (strain DSM 21396 / JCM 16679 / CGMCC 1.7299 / I-0) GN=DGo_CA1130 PE=4 SV=1: HNH [Tuwongella immobilis]VTR97854.1 Uncharacterized protein OS=Deinococcus gobiensis (strain DSM 21396 / JCM 16679 / CGMCC 1.7299 / I-0) GN=DGo_CA1130 PE=4 SV=1: HNH [Tuwongella immobilis]